MTTIADVIQSGCREHGIDAATLRKAKPLIMAAFRAGMGCEQRLNGIGDWAHESQRLMRGDWRKHPDGSWWVCNDPKDGRWISNDWPAGYAPPQQEQASGLTDAEYIADLEYEVNRLGHLATDQQEQAAPTEEEALRMQMADLLTRTANALRGDPGPLRRWSWHDLPERAAAAISMIDILQRSAKNLAEQAAPVVVPQDVLDALDRMCTPLHESRLSGATAEADARCMQIIRDYVLSSAPAPQEHE